MSNFVYKQAALDMESGIINWTKNTIKIMLVDGSYKADREDIVVNSNKVNNPARAEININGYERGHNKSGRHILETWIEKKMSNWMECKAKNPDPWINLGPTNKAICAAIMIREGEFDDTASRLICFIDSIPSFPPFPFIPLGGDYALTISTEGLINLIIMERTMAGG